MYQIGNAIVRIHGTYDREQLKAATEKFIKTAEEKKRQKAKNIHKELDHEKV